MDQFMSVSWTKFFSVDVSNDNNDIYDDDDDDGFYPYQIHQD